MIFQNDMPLQQFQVYYHMHRYKYKPNDAYSGTEVLDLFPTEEKEEKRYWYSSSPVDKVRHMIPVTFEEIYKQVKPMYKQTYLTNGKEYKKEY